MNTNKRRNKTGTRLILENKINTTNIVDQKVKRLVRQEVRSLEKQQEEIKYLDTYTATSATTSPTIYQVSTVSQGAAQFNRVGDKLLGIKFDLDIIANYSFSAGSFSQDFFDNLRIIMFVWRIPTQLLAPVATSILQSTSTFGVMSPFTYEDRKSYKVILDLKPYVTGYYNATTSTSTPTDTSIWKWNVKGHRLNLPIDFSLNGNTGTNHLYLLVMSDSAGSPHPVIQTMVRFYYTDA